VIGEIKFKDWRVAWNKLSFAAVRNRPTRGAVPSSSGQPRSDRARRPLDSQVGLALRRQVVICSPPASYSGNIGQLVWGSCPWL